MAERQSQSFYTARKKVLKVIYEVAIGQDGQIEDKNLPQKIYAGFSTVLQSPIILKEL